MKSKQVLSNENLYFGKIPNDWNWKTIDEIKDVGKALVSGPFGSNIGKRFFRPIGIPVIRGNNLKHDKFIDSGFVFVDDEKANELKNCTAVFDDIIFTAAGTIGQVGIIPKNGKYSKYIISNKQLRLRVNSNLVNPLFAYYWFSSKKMQNYLIVNNVGSALPLLTLRELKAIPIPIPSLPEQNKITKILDDVYEKIITLQNQNKILEQTVQAIFKSWFVDFDGVTEFEDSELGQIPKGWSVDQLGSVCYKITDGSHFSPKEETNGVKMIGTVKNMNEYDFDFNSCKKISDEDYHKLVKNGCKAELGDVLLSKDGTIGLSMLYQNTIDLVLLSSIAIIKTNENFSNYYLKILLSQKNNLSILIGGHSSGSALPRIVLKDLRIFQLLVPNNLVLKKFDNIIRSMYTEIFSNSQKIQNISKTRDALLPKLMSGEIRV